MAPLRWDRCGAAESVKPFALVPHMAVRPFSPARSPVHSPLPHFTRSQLASLLAWGELPAWERAQRCLSIAYQCIPVLLALAVPEWYLR